MLSFAVLDSMKHGVKACTYLIDRCNVTGLYTGEDPFLERACASYTSIYKHYKNVICYLCNGHCYLCNGNPEDSTVDECPLLHTWSMIGFVGKFDFGDTSQKNEFEIGIKAMCDSTSMYDKITVSTTISSPVTHRSLRVSLSI